MANLFELAAKLTLDSSDYEKGIEAAKQAAANFSKGLTAIVTATQNADKVVNAAADSAEQFSTQTSNAADSAEEFRQAETQVTRAAEESANSMSDAADEAKDLSRELDRAESEFDDTEDAVDDYTESADDAAKSTRKLGDEEEKTTKKTSTFGDTLKAILTSDAIKAGLSAIVNGVKAVGRAFINLGKQSVEAYANYEQLVGGVETLFKKSAGEVQKYAANAYKTAGMSANQYMETVTSFSASLLQSLGGDTVKAAKIADMAISDMADNSNKMGVSMESIENAYKGFAKSNFTMLDNLSLGYGGTKQEMQRLLDDANKLNAAQGKYTKYSIDSYSDIVSAIHDVQVNMGIYGTTAKEAQSTIQGSLAMTKAAWQNLLVGIADDSADFDTLINNLVESVTAAGNNLLPRIETTINGIAKLIDNVAPVIVERLPDIISNVAPSLMSAANSLITGLIGAVIELGPTVMQAGTELLLTLVDGLVAGLPQLGNAAMAILTNLANGLANAAPTLIPAAVEAIIGFAMALIAPDNIGALIDSAIALIMGLADGIINALPILIDAIPDIIEALVEALIENAPQLLIASIELVLKLAEGIVDAIPELVMVIPKVITAIYTAFKETNWQELGNHVIDGLINGIGAKIVVIIAKIQDLGNAIKKKFCDFFGIHSPSTLMATMGGYLVDGLVNGIKNMPSKVIAIFTDLKSRITSWGSSAVSSIKSIGGNLVTGLWNGINDKVGWITNKISGFGNAVIDKIKGIFGVHSPSTVMKQIGDYLMQGLSIGVDSNAYKPIRSVSNVGDEMTRAFDFDGSIGQFGGIIDAPAYAPAYATQETNTERLLVLILETLRGMDTAMYSKIQSALDGANIKWNDRELGRFVKSYA